MWPSAARHTSFLTNSIAANAEGETPYSLRLGEKFAGTLLPFGAQVRVRLPNELARELHGSFEPTTDEAVVIDYCIADGGKFAGSYKVMRICDAKEKGIEKATVRTVHHKDLHLLPDLIFPFYVAPSKTDGHTIKPSSSGDRQEGINWWTPQRGSLRPGNISSPLWNAAGARAKSDAIAEARMKKIYHLDEHGRPCAITGNVGSSSSSAAAPAPAVVAVESICSCISRPPSSSAAAPSTSAPMLPDVISRQQRRFLRRSIKKIEKHAAVAMPCEPTSSSTAEHRTKEVPASLWSPLAMVARVPSQKEVQNSPAPRRPS